MSTTHIEPLVILNPDGTVQAITGCTAKSRQKTVEQGELWITRQDNQRVLPYRQGGVQCGPFTGPHGEPPLWQVTLVAAPAAPEQAPAAPALAPTGQPASTGDPAPTGQPTATGDPTPSAPSERIAVLSDLADLIAARRREMPEGSYTTHLFTKGGGKIRKKTGEEAVEVLLAATPEELTSEAADLIYHLMVLLEWEGVRIEEVVRELAHR